MDIDNTNTVLLGTTDPEMIMKRQTKLILPQLPIQHKRCFHLTLSLKTTLTAQKIINAQSFGTDERVKLRCSSTLYVTWSASLPIMTTLSLNSIRNFD